MNRYFQRKEEECEPSKVTLQISSKGIKLVADSLRHFVPSHAVTYVSQGSPPDDDIVSVILLLYNPITKCPVHLHAYRCDSVETADLLAEQLQLLVDLPENQRKISDLEERLQSQGLYPNASGQLNHSRMLLKSCDTGLGGSSGDLIADSSSSEEIGHASDHSHQRPLPPPLTSDPTVPKSDQERIARLYDSLAAELRDKLGGALSGKNAPILLPPKDYEPGSNKTMSKKARQAAGQHKPVDNNGSSSGPSSGIGSDLDDTPNKHRSSGDTVMRPTATQQEVSHSRQHRYSYHEQQAEVVVRRRDSGVVRQLSERRDATLLNRRSMSDLRYRQEESSSITLLRRREESFRDVRTDFQQQSDGRGRVKEALSKFEPPATSTNSRSRSFREPPAEHLHQQQPSAGWSNIMRYRRQIPYQELDQRERFPGLDRDTARVLEAASQAPPQQQQQRNMLQRHKSSEFATLVKRTEQQQPPASVVVVEPTQKVGNRHFRAIRQPN